MAKSHFFLAAREIMVKKRKYFGLFLVLYTSILKKRAPLNNFYRAALLLLILDRILGSS